MNCSYRRTKRAGKPAKKDVCIPKKLKFFRIAKKKLHSLPSRSKFNERKFVLIIQKILIRDKFENTFRWKISLDFSKEIFVKGNSPFYPLRRFTERGSQ